MLRRAIAACLFTLSAGLFSSAAMAQAVVTTADANARPESITVAPDGGVILGNSNAPFIYRARPGAMTAPRFVDASNDGGGSFLGVLSDPASNTLWACQINPVPGTNQRKSFVRGFDLGTGAPKFRWALPGDNNGCNDLTVADDHTLYVSDISNGRIFHVNPATGQGALFSDDRALTAIDGVCFFNGALYGVTIATNNLWRIPMDAAGKAGAPVDIWMDQPIHAPDGLRAAGGHLYIAENRGGRADEVVLSGDKGHIIVIKDGFDNPTAIQPFGDTLWVGDRVHDHAVAVPLPK